MKKLLAIIVLGLGLVLFLTNISKAQESTTVKIDESQMYVKMTDNLPIKGKKNTVYMGDSMLQQRHGMYTDCLIPLFNDEAKKLGGWTLKIIANEPLCKSEKGNKSYFPTYVNGIASEEENNYHYDVKLKGKEDGKYKICLHTGGLNAHCKKKLSSKDFKFGIVFVSEKDSMQRVIEYAGKKGSIVKFIYSEYVDDMARDAFMREFEVDLNDGNIVAYKGTVFEIIEANNATITYKVVRHFKN